MCLAVVAPAGCLGDDVRAPGSSQARSTAPGASEAPAKVARLDLPGPLRLDANDPVVLDPAIEEIIARAVKMELALAGLAENNPNFCGRVAKAASAVLEESDDLDDKLRADLPP